MSDLTGMATSRRAALSQAALAAALLVLAAAPASALVLGGTGTSNADLGDSNYMNGSKITVGSTSAQVTSLSVYVGSVDTAPNNQYQIAIYTNASNAPGTLLVASAAATLTPNAWNTVSVSATLQANTSYWLMYNTNGRTAAVNNMYYDLGSAGQGAYSNAGVAYGTWPASFGGASLTNAIYALYATVSSGPTITPGGSPTATPSPDPRGTTGEWAGLMNWPLVAMHLNLLKNGKVLFWDYEPSVTHPMLWDPATLALTNTPTLNLELWCAGQTQLADGRVLAVGGHQPSVGQVGIKNTFQYLPDTNTWISTSNMLYARWYPTLNRLADGRVMIFTGQITDGVFADTPEIYDPAIGSSSLLTGISTPELHDEEYASNYILSTGKVLSISPQFGPVQLFDINGPTWTHVNTTPILFGSSVQYRPGRILMSGGGSAFFAASVRQAAVLDLSAQQPTWRSVGTMSLARYMHNLVMLPTGDVLAVGGSTTVDETAQTGPLPVELWSPTSETWTTLASMAVPRMYHSTALLLPDGRVLAAGGGHNLTAPSYPSGQVFSPPYLFKGARPSITSAPDVVSYGASTFSVTTPDALNISSVSLIALGAVTHSNDMNQLYTELPFTASAGQLAVSPPLNSNQVPPGYYMLFIVDANRVPSVSKILQVSGVSPPTPSPTATPPAPTPTRTLPPPSATATATAAGPSPSATASSTVGPPPPTATASATRTLPPPSATATATVPVPSPSATTPPTTLGLTTIATTQDTGDRNHLNGSRVVTSAGGSIVSMSVYVGSIDSQAASRKYQMAIYTDNAGLPGTLVASTAAGTLVANSWNTLAISATLQGNTSYWLMYNTNGRTDSVNNLRYNAGAAGQGAFSSSGVTYGTWPSTFPASTLTNAVYSLYASFGP